MAVAVVGTGFIGPVHAEALRRLSVEVRGILGSNAEKGQAAASALGLTVAYRDYDEILSDQAVDVVHLASPNNTHFDYARRALGAGKHVVCEKPLAMNSEETAELVRLARQHANLVTAVNYNIRYYPMALHARHLVRSGELGTPYHVNGSYLQDWLLFDNDWSWRVEAGAGGALRAVGDIGTHWLDLLQWITGLKVTALVAHLATFLEKRRKPSQSAGTFANTGNEPSGEWTEVDTEDYAAAWLEFESGVTGTFHVSQVNAGRKNRLGFEIACSNGSVAWDGERPNELWIGHRGRPNEILIKDPSLLSPVAAAHADYPGGHAEGFPDTFKQLYRDIYGYIEAGDYSAPRSFPTFEDGHHEALLCEAILRSHQERRWVSTAEGTTT